MLANFLEKSKPINFIIYLGFFFCFFLITVFSNLITDEFTWTKVVESVSYLFLLLIIYFFYNFVVSKNKLTFDHSYAFFLFVLTVILFIDKLLEFKVLVLLLVYLLFLRKVYSLRSPKKIIQKLFDSGFWLGVLFVLEPFSILFSVLIFTSIVLQQKITIHSLITPIIGFSTPLIIYFTYVFWIDDADEFLKLIYFDVINNIFIYAEDYTIRVFGILLLLTTISILLKSPKALSVNNYFKKSWILLVINSVIALIFALIITEKNGSEVIFFLIPSSIIIANGFEVIKKTIVRDVLFGLLLFGTIITYFFL